VMDEPLTKADPDGLRNDLRGEIRATKERLGAGIDGLEATMDSGFAMVGRLLAETRADLMRHTDVRFEALRDDIKRLADGLLACNERLASHVQDPDAHRRGWGQ
jgi:hypothetical protein